ncbi:MAG: tetratricopeptide repeat protein, partial [Cyanobacteria bacterium SZAS LIN-2]|nr:tetratricopeptide repeat protein [Cyanobacteria bacterium SZAS LIN-2]
MQKSFTAFKKLQAYQKLFKEKIFDDKRFQWTSRGLYALTLVWACFLFLQSMPYYQAIGLGDAAYKHGDYQAARLYFEKALNECKHFSTVAGTNDADAWQNDQRAIRAMNNLAEDLRVLGLYALAEPYYKKTVALARKKFAATRPEVAIALNNLGMLQREEGHYAESEKSYQEALEL